MTTPTSLRLGVLLALALASLPLSAAEFASHPPQRPLPQASPKPREPGPAKFVDASLGNDQNDGTEAKPWRTLGRALRKLQPGDTLYLRGGIYYEQPVLTKSGTEAAPITIRAFPGELPIIDGGLREFYDDPAGSWMPAEGGAAGEYVSKKTYHQFDTRRTPQQFLPGAWEPMWGIEEDRPLALGAFGDSLVPLHGYRKLLDLRAESEFFVGGKGDRTTGVYCGPGVWFNRETGRVHIRLAHNRMPGLGDRGYRGETDPRKLPLSIALGFGEDVLRISGVKHVRLHGLAFRGATGSPLINLYGSQHVELDHLHAYGGFPALLVDASQNIQVTHCAFRGLAAPWSGRSHMKYLGTASYQIVFQNHQPVNENIEIAHCELTDDHDGAFLRYVKNLRFHHNFVDGFNDDGLECGPKLRSHTLFIYQNFIGACLGQFQQHEIEKDESPLDHDAGSGVYVYRNVIDNRAGVQYTLPKEADPSGEFMRYEGALISDHGGPVWPVLKVYHNTLLRRGPVFRDYYLFGLGAGGLRNTERDVYNNLFVQADKPPGVVIPAGKEPGALREGGNLLWGLSGPPASDPFAKFRASPLFKESLRVDPAGWTMRNQYADPQFVRLTADPSEPADLRLKEGSPARKAGVEVPKEWPDPLRTTSADPPDVGALPHGATPWTIGVDGRISAFGRLSNDK